ncbi:MAG: hypothetical protein K2X74_16980, partial [Acetobacteraceae bacterium]|nr:hypothetical protein [Acetobacteraceae bacterium]
MIPLGIAALSALLLAPTPSAAQPRPFTCVGVERLEEDVFEIPFAREAAAPGEAARANIAAAAALAKAHP